MNVTRSVVLFSLVILTVIILIGRTLLLNQFNRLKKEVSNRLKEELKDVGKQTVAKFKNDIGDIDKEAVANFKNDIGEIGKGAVANFKNGLGDIGKKAVAKFETDIGKIESEAKSNIGKIESEAKSNIGNIGKSKNDEEDVQEQVEKWAKSIRGRKVFSQNDEDGAIEEVFRKIGTTDKVYVEFGVENGDECNTRHLRESLGWDVKNSLLMDGGHERGEINLKKVIFWPDNIVNLFERFGVKKNFDFLSEDSDSYDFFMTEAILEAEYSPRVIMMEYNANFELDEARSILPPDKGESWLRWDESTYQGCSLLALKLLLERFNYSVVWCNKVNCLAVKDSELGTSLRLPLEVLDKGRLDQHRCDDKHRSLAIIDKDGRWSGKTDGGKGSPHIRCQK